MLALLNWARLASEARPHPRGRNGGHCAWCHGSWALGRLACKTSQCSRVCATRWMQG